MKSVYLFLMVLFAVTLVGCGEPADNSLATDGATAEEFAQYEKELDAVSGGGSYEDAVDDDAGDDAPE